MGNAIETTAVIRTEFASKYMQQLCKHFAHKVTAEYDAHKAFVELPPGPCRMNAEGDALMVHCQSESAKGVEVMQQIIESHIVKFAWREELDIAWQTQEIV